MWRSDSGWGRDNHIFCTRNSWFVGRIFYRKPHEILYFGEKNIFYEGWNFNSGNYLFTTDTK